MLWDIAYDEVIGIPKPRGSEVICYADDTIILVSGRDMEGTIERANEVTGMVVRAAQRLGLEVSAGKTQAMLFRQRGKRRVRDREIRIRGKRIVLQNKIKYLGLVIKDDWSFKDHLETVAKKAEGVMGKIERLLANRKGPSERKWKLYCNMVNSIVLYGAPIWAEDIKENPKIGKGIISVQRRAALRVIRAYKTVSTETALVMARNPPVELLAAKMKAVHDRKKIGVNKNITITEIGLNLIRKQEHEKMVRAWKDRVRDSVRKGKIKGEFLIYFNEWMKREHGELTFWATQVITKHGSFRAYTYRIGKSGRTNCGFCEAIIDDNIHNLVECKEWEEDRGRLAEAMGGEITSLRVVLQGITGSEGKWKAFMDFCEGVMRSKEEREREEQARERRERLIEEAAESVGVRCEDGGRVMEEDDAGLQGGLR